ncbi:DNA-3-methyladenine glycosylase 2 family protein [Stigmatella sp. ncwal1]|uniref:DNA-3-methyladenine glycosylase II n=1 Tax=Stigmatella ashevillensis TaxID=2995309 RepID=A0ABT5DKJ3_9BACT|nr:DNA-3-methyladenine glycosylase 2 family protein [Stigmatella ashevillena]MDC0714109.1 DNA-3-methyladenine glycosylase 2 family protein [Stigmatella ashevillena]
MPASPRAAVSLPDAFTVSARRALARADPSLAALMRKVGPFRLQLKPLLSPFAALAESIIYQQLHGRAAATIFARLCERVGGGTGLTPEALLATPVDALRAAGVSGAKAAALKDLAEKTRAGTVPSLAQVRRLSDEALIERFTEVRGIGQWTVEMLLIFQLGRPDVLPVDDYAIRKGFMFLQGLKESPRPREVLAYGERWRPWRSVASWYLWRSLELPEIQEASRRAKKD